MRLSQNSKPLLSRLLYFILVPLMMEPLRVWKDDLPQKWLFTYYNVICNGTKGMNLLFALLHMRIFMLKL